MFLPEAIVPRESGKEQTPLVRQGRPERLPLSYAQQRLWFIDRLKEGTGTEYNALGALRLRGELYREALERTINTIVGRHESLRTHFAEIDGEALQVIERELRIEVPVEDLSELEEGEQQERVQAAMRREREQPFDLAQGPVLRMKLLRLGEQEHILLRTMHHIVSDGWSEGVFNREFMILYEAYREGREDPLKPLTVQYADFAIWQRKWLDSGVLDEGLAYWKEQLRGIPERLELPTDRARPAVQTFGAEVYQVSLSKELTTALKRISQANQATLYMTLLAGFGVLLSRYSGQDDIVVGSPIANRQEEQLEEMIGFFVNTLVMRVRVRPSMSFEELLGEVRRTALEAYQHQDVPFERLVEELSPQRSLNTAPIFQVVFALQNAPRAASRMKGLQVEAIRGEEPRVRTDLEVHAWEEGGRIELYWLYNRDLFDRWRMEQMAGHYERVLEAVVANPVQVIGSLELLSSEERRQILEEWNDTKREVPVATLPVLFEEQVERTPGAVAVVYEEQSLTYRELNERANQLAHYLMERRIGPEDLVALAVPRSLEMVVALLGILKAGAAYLPLDPEYPEERLRFMVEDARPVCVITTSEVKLHVPEDGWRILLDERETGEALAGRARSNPLDHERTGALTPQNPAYVIYTSGSMGVPKAVTVSHRNLLTSTLARLTCYQESVKRFLLVSSFSFDSSVAGIFWTLSQGGELHLLKEGSQRDAGLLVECINISEITHLLCLPSLYGALLALEPDKSLRSLRVVILAGEECPGALLARHERINPWVTHYNEYGPTENTVWSTVYQYCSWQRNAKVPIGRPIWNTRVYVLDGSLGAVPVGVAGELYIAGAGLARGYLKRPGLTAERFVANPFESDGSRMYRTGDLARWREDGNLEFLGRVDQQVKIRGFRVELGEIEAVLREQDGVQEAVVVAREDEPGEKRLVGYVVGAAGKSVDASALRQELTKKLPDYMVPAAVMVLERIPLTANGKVDRKALPAPEFISTSDYREGRTPEEEILCGLFAEVLGVSRVGLDDNFFEMGGHSLLATRLVSRIRATLGVELAIRTLFEWPRVGELGPRLRESGKEQTPLVRQERPERLPLSYAQQRLWFIDQLEEESTEYNVPQALRLRGELYREALERTINTIVGRHESLRTHFAEIDGEALQVIERELRIEVPVEDLSELEEGEQQERVQAAMRREREQPFDLAQGPVLRMKLLRLGEQEHILLRTMHHIVSDGWSEGVFNREFMILYEAYREGREDPLKPLTVQYADFAIWQRKWLDSGVLDEGLAYWKEQLRGIPERLELPTDRARPAVQTFGAEVYQVSLSKELTTALKRISQANQATLYMTLLAGFGVLLSRYSGQDDIVVGSPIANRQEEQLEEMIGFFVNTLVMRVRVRPSMSFEELLGEVRRTALEAYQHQDVPFERLVEELSPQRSLNTTPIFQVVFALQNAPMVSPQMKGLETEPVAGGELRVRYDLEVHAWEEGGRIELYWLYNRDLFDRWRMEQMAGHYERVLEAVVANPVQVIGSLELLSSEERRQILEEWNDTAQEIREATLPELFEEQVERTPGAVAVVYEEQSLTYRELNERANQLAHYLMERRIGPEDLVALAVPRSLEMVVALLGILKAGAAYLPLDPEYPEERLRFMVEDARPACVLTVIEVGARLPESCVRVQLHELGTIRELAQNAVNNPTKAERTRPLTSQNAAYIMYTSGSTGIPKGVTVGHSAVVRLVCNPNYASLDARQIILQLAPISFDASTFEIWGSLLNGGKLVLFATALPVLEDLGRALRRHAITTLWLTAGLFHSMANEQLDDLLGIEQLLAGGDVLAVREVKRVLERLPGCQLINGYGPTEGTTFSCCHRLRPSDRVGSSIPIGRPISNTRVYVLGQNLEPVPIGVTGELYISGAGLARGYMKRPGLTAERFVADPYGAAGTRMYRTGDLVRWREDGNLEFLGRTDHQIKLRGFRIELGEIESVLRTHSEVHDAVVVAREDQAGEKRLVAYVLREQSEADQIRARASHITAWQQLYESTYRQNNGASGDFNITGWESSYTGKPIPAEEMRIWVEETVERLRSLNPQQVLEIGCGTGLLLTRLGKNCTSYIGLDFSEEVLGHLKAYLSTREDLKHVELRQGLAHELSSVGDNSVDLVILNSVVQYFPDVDYLLEVLRETVRVTRRGGCIFVGDVRNLPLLEAYRASVQSYKAGELTVRNLLPQIRQTQDDELVLDPRLFEELGRRWEKVARVEAWLKAGKYDNELSRYRYDVVMRVGDEKEAVVEPDQWVNWDEGGRWREELEEALRNTPEIFVGVRGIRDRRVARDVEAVRLLHNEESGVTAAKELRAASGRITGEDPNGVMELAKRLGVSFQWRGFSREGVYEGLFNLRWRVVEREQEMPSEYYRRYGNPASRGVEDVELGRGLKEYLKEKLPEYMVPMAVMALPCWPLTSNGKLDRKALPAPDFTSMADHRAPRSPEERILCTLFADVLGVERVGIDDNFFELGGHSLAAARLTNRARAALGMELSIRDIFSAKTVRDLSVLLALVFARDESTVRNGPADDEWEEDEI